MQLNGKMDSQTRAILTAMGGAAVAAVVAMLVPVGIWEAITGSTGISEMIPATRAPLGDTARALIAFGVAAFSFAIVSVLLLRRKPAPRAVAERTVVYETAADHHDEADPDYEASPSLASRLKDRVSAFVEARRGRPDIEGLEDLPKLRSGDAHPDAPARRPLLATRDLADPVSEVPLPAAPVAIAEIVREPETVQPEPEPVVIAETVEEVPVEPFMSEDTLFGETLARMVDRLDAAIAERATKLAQLELLVEHGSTVSAAPLREVQAAPVIAEAQAEAPEPAPKLEAVRPVPVPASAPAPANEPVATEGSEELDAALRSALETLHRMNARTR